MSDNYPINRDTLMASEVCGGLDRHYRSRLDHYEDTDPLGLAQRLISDLEAAGWVHDGLPVTREPTGASRGLEEVLEAYAARYAEEANSGRVAVEGGRSRGEVEPDTPRDELSANSEESGGANAPARPDSSGCEWEIPSLEPYEIPALESPRTIERDPVADARAEEVAAIAATISAPGLRPMDPAMIAALVSCPSKAEAARVAGVARSTIYARLKDPLFCEAYEAVRAECMAEAVVSAREGLALGASEAVEALRSIVRDPWASSADRTRAATQLLNYHLLTRGDDES